MFAENEAKLTRVMHACSRHRKLHSDRSKQVKTYLPLTTTTNTLSPRMMVRVVHDVPAHKALVPPVEDTLKQTLRLQIEEAALVHDKLRLQYQKATLFYAFLKFALVAASCLLVLIVRYE